MFSNLWTRAILVFATFFIVSSIVDVSAVKCYRCSSDAPNAEFCNDPFNASIISEQQKRWIYVECSYPYGQINPYGQESSERAVCKKVKHLVNDKIVVSRSCFWESVNAQKNDCMNGNYPSYVKIIFCETCSTDGCNGAAMGPVVENGNTIDDRINAINEKKNLLLETSTAISPKSDLSLDHEVLVTKNLTTCHVGSVQDDNDECIVELMLKIKKRN